MIGIVMPENEGLDLKASFHHVERARHNAGYKASARTGNSRMPNFIAILLRGLLRHAVNARPRRQGDESAGCVDELGRDADTGDISQGDILHKSSSHGLVTDPFRHARHAMARAGLAMSLSQAARIGVMTAQIMCLAHMVNQHMFEVRLCRGASMLPTLSLTGDLIVYARLPFLRWLSQLPFASQDLRDRYPKVQPGLPSGKQDPSAGLGLQIGDVVVSTSPTHPAKTVCKRVLGLPGDTILVDPRDYMSEDAGLLAAHAHADPMLQALVALHSARTVTVPPGHVWLTGDNLGNSTDSRQYGAVPMALIKGRVLARVYPHPGWIRSGLSNVQAAMEP